MVYSLDLNPEEMERIKQAKAAGINVDRFLRGAIASLPAARRSPRRRPRAIQRDLPMPQPQMTRPFDLPEYTDEKRQAAIAYFAEEVRKAADATAEELAEGERELQELLDALDRNRRDAGERSLYPE